MTTAITLISLLLNVVANFTGSDDPSASKIAEAIRRLDSESEAVRAHSLETLTAAGIEGKAAVLKMIDLLRDTANVETNGIDRPAVAWFAERALEATGTEALVELTAAVTSDNPLIRRHAAFVLGRIGPVAHSAIPALLSALDPDDVELRRAIVGSLAAVDPMGDVSIPRLIKLLKDADETVRRSAATALGSYKGRAKESVPALLAALQDTSPAVRGSAARALGEIAADGENVIPALIPLLRGTDGYSYMISSHFGGWQPVTDDAANALAAFGAAAKPAVPVLVAELRNPESASLGALAPALAKIAPESAEVVPDFLNAIRGEASAPGYRRTCAYALADMGATAKSAIPALRELLQSQDEEAAVEAAAVLVLIDLPRQHDAMAKLVASLDKDEYREIAAEALTRLGPLARDVVPSLIAHLEDEIGFLHWDIVKAVARMGPAAKGAASKLINHTGDDLWQDEAKDALVSIGEDVIASLVECLENLARPPDVRAGAAETLGRFGPKASSAVPALVNSLTDSDRHVRARAAEAIGEIRSRSNLAMPALAAALADKRPQVRASAAAAIGRFGPEGADAVGPLVEALQDEYVDVRASAATALSSVAAKADTVRRALRKASADRNPYVRHRAAEALRGGEEP